MHVNVFPVPCTHPLLAENRKICEDCECLWEVCYPCLVGGFRGGQAWWCPRCRVAT